MSVVMVLEWKDVLFWGDGAVDVEFRALLG